MIKEYEFIKNIEKDTIHTDNKEILNNALKRIEELEAQIEKMKRCDMCKYGTRLGYCKIRQQGGACENRNKWEIKEND